jgi:uncharacterized protein
MLRFGDGDARMEGVMAVVSRFLQAPEAHFFLFGPRGTGKSTWLAETFPDALILDLLSPEHHRRFAARPERLRELVLGNRERSMIVIDEIQKVPELLPVIHQLIEANPGPRFALTGSSSRKLKRAGVDLLAGRALLRSMHPFFAAELGTQFRLDRALVDGLVPLVWDSAIPSDVLDAYVGLYLREEVQAEGLVRNLGSFARFLEAISFSHGGVLNVSEVARECEVKRKTAEGYLEILEDLLLSFRVPAFTKHAKRHLRTKPKFFLFDAGVFRSLRPAGPLDRPEEIDGAALEGLVAQHLRAWCDYTSGGNRLYFWRTKGGLEVDFVVYGARGIQAIEVKRSRDVRSNDLKGLRTFQEDYPEAEARLLYMGDEALQIGDVRCIPCADYLATVRPGEDLP